MTKPLPASVLMALVILPACAHSSPVTFKVVNSRNGQPVSQVTITRLRPRQQPANPGWFPVTVYYPDPLHPEDSRQTDAHGLLSFPEAKSDCRFQISRDGYHRETVRLKNGTPQDGTWLAPLPTDQTPSFLIHLHLILNSAF